MLWEGCQCDREVLPLLVVDKSNFSPSRLTFPPDTPYSSFSEGACPFSSFQAKRILHEPTDVLVLPRAGKSDRPTWGGCARSPHLGHSSAVSSPARPSAVVASLLSLCAPPCFTPNDAHPLTSARWQLPGATVPTVDSCDGSRQNHPTLDGARGALLPIAKGFRLRGIEARWDAV